MNQFPSFYDADQIGTLFHPDMAAIAAEAAAANLKPSGEDRHNTHMVIIDMQVDFCHPDGTLHVPGAVEDLQRTIEFIYTNAERITNITCSLDSHLSHQIFSPGWWVDADGNHPAPFTLISYDDIVQGTWRPVVAPKHSVDYVKKLEAQAKKTLTIWPYHTMIGSLGYALDPALWTAVFWHSMARKTQPTFLSKGSVPQTEHYSIIQPEIPIPGHPMGGKNKPFLDTLARADTIIIAGEAESHCVLESVEDIVEDFGDKPDQLQKVYFLKDCTSSVQHPDIDFHALAQNRFREFEQKGVNFIESTDPVPVR